VLEFISSQEKEVVEGVQRNFQQVVRVVSLSARSIALLCADKTLQAEESFKGLRRKLPKTKQEFNWQVLARAACALSPAALMRVLQGLSRHSLARELTAHTPTKSN
jgi:hypothetical protein